MADDAWDPTQYHRFGEERRQPFEDLLALLRPVAGGRIVDLGCGTGELTRQLHAVTGAAVTLGVDRSPAMLARAEEAGGTGGGGEAARAAGVADGAAAAEGAGAAVPTGDGVGFMLGDIGSWTGSDYDLVFANASLHWVPHHRQLIGRLGAALAAGGQLAFQVPANFDHPAHRLLREVAGEEPFWRELSGQVVDEPGGNVLAPEAYASILDESGFVEQHVRLQVYGHHLDSAAEVVEWMKGTALTPFRAALPPAVYDGFLARYQEQVVARLGAARPYFYPFKRILAWARRP